MRLRTLMLPLLLAMACRTAQSPAVPAGTCTTNDQCSPTEFCSKLFDSCNDPGKCEPRPADCVEHGHVIDKPVCGCDGKTYGNFCLAAAAGVNVKSEGKCAAPGEPARFQPNGG